MGLSKGWPFRVVVVMATGGKSLYLALCKTYLASFDAVAVKVLSVKFVGTLNRRVQIRLQRIEGIEVYS